jgi:hypothetical protein
MQHTLFAIIETHLDRGHQGVRKGIFAATEAEAMYGSPVQFRSIRQSRAQQTTVDLTSSHMF